MLSSVGGHFQSALVGSQFLGAASPHFFIGLRSAFRTILDVKASLTHLLHAQAVPVRELAPERELLSVSKGSAFGR